MKEKDGRELMEAVGELRKEVEALSPDPEKLEKINLVLDKQEEANQELAKTIELSKKESEEQKERLDTLEAELARKGGAGSGINYKETEEYKNITAYCQQGSDLDREVKATLRTDSSTQGGVLVSAEMDSVIVKNITEMDAIRTVARVRTIAAKSLEMPKRTTNMVAYYEGEAEAGQEGNQTYGSETVTAFRQSVTVPITQDLLMNSAFDMESEIMTDASEAFALGEGNGFVAGSGFKQPEGIISNATLQAAARTSSTSATIDADDVILLTGDLKVGYNPVYLMNRVTLANLRTKKATTNSYLWQPGLNGPVSNTINGYSYLIAPSMQDIASNSYSIAFGDFRRGYTIVDRTGMSIVRDDVTSKKQAIIEFTFHRWNTGQVVLTEAIKLLKTAA